MKHSRFEQEVTERYAFVKLIDQKDKFWQGRVIRFPNPKHSVECRYGKSIGVVCRDLSEKGLRKQLDALIQEHK